MKQPIGKVFSRWYLFVVCFVLSTAVANAQSSIEVKSNRGNAFITVKNFPKNATVLIIDDNLNLLHVTATNEFGVASVILDDVINNNITARTVHGDHEASYKVEMKTTVTSNKEEAPSTNKRAKA